jgi:succinate-semialdehyde dehydrogenase / glutarate-semialdehyde dehydrogenase
MQYASYNPYTRITTATYPYDSDERIAQALASLQKRFETHRYSPLAERQQLLERVAADLLANKQLYAETITREVGKPIRQSLAEVEKSAWVCQYFAREGATHLSPEEFAGNADEKVSILYQPVGILLQIMPWNFPFWQVFRFLAPALLVGNVILLKHAPNVPDCAKLIHKLFQNIFPGILENIFAKNEQIPQILQDNRVQGLGFTGSNRAGAVVGGLAGQNIKKSVLELGGNDACIICADADLDKAVKGAVWSRLQNTGQTCISTKRFIIDQRIYADFVQKSISYINGLVQTDPFSEKADLGTLARPDLLAHLSQQVDISVQKGAKILLHGGHIPDTNFFQTMILSDIPADSPAYREELFGNVLCLFPFEQESEALRLANDSIYGLGASIWTQDEEKAQFFAQRLEAGAVSINQMVKSDPRFPFGGIKQSGYGRELGKQGLLEFANIKTISRL